MDFILLGMFIVTFASVLILPGPNSAFAVGQSLKYGVIGAMPVALGFMTATGLHAVLVFAGLGVFVNEYQLVMIALKWTGVGYLLYMTYKAVTAPVSNMDITPQSHSKLKMFLAAMFVSLTNPKALLASLMIYPLFVNANHAYFFQAIVLGVSAMAVSFSIYSLYIVAATRFKDKLVSSRLANKIVGSLYFGAATALALK